MSKLKHIINGFVWTIVIMYFTIIAAVHIPYIQSTLGNKISDALEQKLGTRVRVVRIDVGFLNRIIIDGVIICDKSGKTMLKASRLAAKIDYYELIRHGRIYISSAQVFGLNGSFYCKDAQSKPNYQFMLDSLASKDTTSKSSVELSISSLIIRHGAIKYDRYDVAPTPKQFNTAHIDVRDISAHFVIPYYNKENIIAEVKKLSLTEHSGLNLNNLTFKLKAGADGAELKDFELKSNKTAFYINQLKAIYKMNNGKIIANSLRWNGEIGRSVINPSDFGTLVPALTKIDIPVIIKSSFNGTDNSIFIKDIAVNTSDNVLALTASGSLTDLKNPVWHVDVRKFRCDIPKVERIASSLINEITIPEFVKKLGVVHYNGRFAGNKHKFETTGTIASDAGTMAFEMSKNGRQIVADLNAKSIDLHNITGNTSFGEVACKLSGKASLPDKGLMPEKADLKGTISRFDYNGYTYRNIAVSGLYDTGLFDGLLALDDNNGRMNVEGMLLTKGGTRKIDVKAAVRGLNPEALKLSNKWRSTIFDVDLDANINIVDGASPFGSINVNGFTMTSANDVYRINNIGVLADNGRISMDSDFGHAELSGRYDLKHLATGIVGLLNSKLPTLFTKQAGTNNDYTIDAEINDTEWLNRLFNIPLTLNSPLKVKASVNDKSHNITLDCSSKSLTYGGGVYENIHVTADTPSDTLHATASVNKVMGNGHKLGLNIKASAINDKLITKINWNNHRPHPIIGTLFAETVFSKNESGKPDINVSIKPSEVLVSDTAWHVLPSEIRYSGGNLAIDNFSIEHNRQHIRIDGMATRSSNDSITVDLQDVDVNYVLNLVNFHSVEFKGLASGKAYVKSVFFEPDAYADLLVSGFRFEDGRMGDLSAHVNWNKNDKQIDIDAVATDSDNGKTIINGYVSPARNHIDLGIEAQCTNIEFLESFCGTFMNNVAARANGKVRVAGPLNCINLTGLLTVDGSVHMKPLNVDYTLENDTIRFVPDNIIFKADTIRDRNGNIGIVDGCLHHEHLTHLTYNLGIRTDHMLCYDTRGYGDETFYGTAYGTGLCTIQGGNGRIDIDVNIKPEKNSFIEYNAASPEAISGQEYITWHDATPQVQPSDSLSVDSVIAKPHNHADGFVGLASIPSDLRINFTIDMTPDATLRVLMDRTSGDYIALNGTGSLRATYFNKGSFDMFGTYLIDHGLYKLTIQNIIKKEFQFKQGGTIVFGGDPYNAALNLKALYTVNGVPLSDLHLGRSFSSNNIRVDCMMNITGTPQTPRVDFDLDLPTVNSDAKQMVKTIINGEEEMNQQVVYLLSVGRFYLQNNNDAAQNENQQSQTSLAMQSLLSGTISQQINSLLGSLVKNNNWSFGANISTGDEGFNNAEYEGLLTGRLLNNRLIINGQFGYRDNANATTSFIGDFDISYLLFPSGNLAIKVYNQTNDRYFTKSSLNTQGIGLMMKKDFNTIRDLFNFGRKRNKVKNNINK